MHMADALVKPIVAGTMYACSGVTMGYSVNKVRLESDTKKIPIMGVMGAFVFATQMINFTIPGTGSSGHLCGGMLLSAVLGPYAGFLTMIGVLLIQCLLFADGGLLALGCNIWNMAFYGCFVGALVVWRLIMKNGMNRTKITVASILGCVITLQMGAFSVTLQTLCSGITELPFDTFLIAMQPIHLAIGLVEGVITSTVLCFIYEARPEILWLNYENTLSQKKENRLSFKGTITVLGVATVVIGGLLSLFASSNPDGLEWSIEKVTGSTEIVATGKIYDVAENIQKTTALLPDYAFSFTDSAVGTSFSGIIGGVVVIAVCVIVSYIFKFIQRKQVD